MIIFLSDSDGDDVAIDARHIIAVTVGEIRRPALVPANGHDDDTAPASPLRVTLVHTAAGPLVVSQSMRAVVDAWQAALKVADALTMLEQTLIDNERDDAERMEAADVCR